MVACVFHSNMSSIFQHSKKTKYNAFYTLEDAVIEFIDIRDVMPPDVQNLCRKQPMIPAE